MSLNNAEFNEVRKDQDTDEPLDGRVSQPAAGSSDAPASLDAEDPLRGVDQVLEESDADPLALDPDLPEEQRAAEGYEEGDAEGLDEEHSVNQPDQRESPDQQ